MSQVSSEVKRLTIGRYIYLGDPVRTEYQVLRRFKSAADLDGFHPSAHVVTWITLIEANGRETTRAVQNVARQMVREGDLK